MKQISALCGRNTGFEYVKAGGIYIKPLHFKENEGSQNCFCVLKFSSAL
jgi:hypothetical protein